MVTLFVADALDAATFNHIVPHNTDYCYKLDLILVLPDHLAVRTEICADSSSHRQKAIVSDSHAQQA